jgi:hypothetical protein
MRARTSHLPTPCSRPYWSRIFGHLKNNSYSILQTLNLLITLSILTELRLRSDAFLPRLASLCPVQLTSNPTEIRFRLLRADLQSSAATPDRRYAESRTSIKRPRIRHVSPVLWTSRCCVANYTFSPSRMVNQKRISRLSQPAASALVRLGNMMRLGLIWTVYVLRVSTKCSQSSHFFP